MSFITLKTNLVNELKCRTEPVAICCLVEDYGSEVKQALREMRRDGTARLIASGDNSRWTSEDLAASIQGDGEIFVLVEAA